MELEAEAEAVVVLGPRSVLLPSVGEKRRQRRCQPETWKEQTSPYSSGFITGAAQ